jgi:protoporphyrinogen oxidase
VAAGSASAIWFRSRPRALAPFRPDWNGAIVDRSVVSRDTEGFTGDDSSRAHRALWNLETFLAQAGLKAEVDERVEVAVLGGGMSGLLSAYFLRDRKPVVLEYGKQLGGNSRGESWDGIEYSIGAAYITRPEEGSRIHATLKSLGLLEKLRFESSQEKGTVLRGDRLVHDFWEKAGSPDAQADFERLNRRLAQVLKEEYPEVPYRPAAGISRKRFEQLDRMSLKDWARQELGELHPEVVDFVRRYCWSSFAGDWHEISAWQGLNFLASDQDTIAALPGGNAAISQALAVDLAASVGNDRLRTGCMVVQVDSARPDGVLVSYVGEDARLRTLLAQRVVVAMPKFVAKRVIRGMSEADGGERLAAMNRLKYRAYTVTNILLNRKVVAPGYEVFVVPTQEFEKDPRQLPFTDLIFGNWAAEKDQRSLSTEAGRTVLTLYRSLPYDEGRSLLLNGAGGADFRHKMKAVLPAVLSAVGATERDVEDLRFSRFGHALPLAEPGLLADGVAETASRALGERIAFAHQDVFANPCFESAFSAAQRATDWIRSGT